MKVTYGTKKYQVNPAVKTDTIIVSQSDTHQIKFWDNSMKYHGQKKAVIYITNG